VALGLAEAGADVAIVGRDQAACDTVAAELRMTGRQALPLGADVSSSADVRRFVDATLAQLGRIDVLITCAGVISPTRFLDMAEEQWDQTLAINLKGTYLSMQAVLPHMIERGSGKIVTVTGPAALRVSPNGVSAYAASKAGIIALTKTVAREVQATGVAISINCVSPVATTRMTEALAHFQGKTLDQFGAGHPRGKMPSTEDVVPTFVFLASSGADHMTGQVIAVDDGRSL
jgi:NAD(P)-dependent dehydrogenase (short-subunit alcohol dehydrogenase family)